MNTRTLPEAMTRAISLAIASLPSHVVGISRGCLWGAVAHHLHRLAPADATRAQAEAEYQRQVASPKWGRFVYADDAYTQRRD